MFRNISLKSLFAARSRTRSLQQSGNGHQQAGPWLMSPRYNSFTIHLLRLEKITLALTLSRISWPHNPATTIREDVSSFNFDHNPSINIRQDKLSIDYFRMSNLRLRAALFLICGAFGILLIGFSSDKVRWRPKILLSCQT